MTVAAYGAFVLVCLATVAYVLTSAIAAMSGAL